MQLENDNQNEFKQRLEWILAGRKITPWAKNIGFTSGTMSRLSKGEAPGVEILTAIMRTENANLSWLLDGHGLPFIIDTHFNSESFLTMLRMHDADSPYKVYFTMNKEQGLAVFIFAQPASYFLKKDKLIQYRQIEVVVGPYTEKIRNAIFHAQVFKNSSTHAFILDDLEFRSLIRGQYGTYQLFGDKAKQGLVEKATPDADFMEFFRTGASAAADQTTKRKSLLPDT